MSGKRTKLLRKAMKIDITAVHDLRAAGNAAYHRGAETGDAAAQDQGKAMVHAAHVNRRMLRKGMQAVKNAPAKYKARVVDKIGALVAKGRQPPQVPQEAPPVVVSLDTPTDPTAPKT